MTEEPRTIRVFVVFSGQTDIAWLRVLREGFRHCFVALCDGHHWITLDPLSNRIEVAVQPVEAGFDLAGWYRAQGLTVVETRVLTPARPAPLAPCTCVETVKRTIGLRDRRVVTPWQLFRRLTRNAVDIPGK